MSRRISAAAYGETLITNKPPAVIAYGQFYDCGYHGARHFELIGRGTSVRVLDLRLSLVRQVPVLRVT